MVMVEDEVDHERTADPQGDCEALTQLLKIASETEESNNQLSTLVDGLKGQIESGKLSTNDGISLLDVKNQMMLSYLINTVYIIAKKFHGKSIEDDSAIERLVEIRTVLERIRPLEQKLKYMMEKLVKTSLTGMVDENDPTHFRANPQNMADNMADSESESEEEGTTAGKKSDKKTGIYVPPRVAPVHYDEEESQAVRRQRQIERAKKRALHSSVVEELREEYLDTPVEVSHGNALKASLSKHQEQKKRYEEEYFTRLPSVKKEKHRSRHSMTVGNIGDHLTHFEDIQVLEDEGAFQGQSKRKRKSAGKPSKKKGFKKRRSR